MTTSAIPSRYKEVKALVITGYGLNCEVETAVAFETAGATAEKVHLNDLLNGNRSLDEFHILAFIGGFSFGDHIGAGTVFSNRIKHQMRDQLEKFVADGKLIIGICNGFQTITRLGLVPALGTELFKQQVALAHNDQGVFRDDWSLLKANPASPCVFTKDIDSIPLPIRHGEGCFAVESAELLAELEEKNLVALRYANPNTGEVTDEFPYNPNGSINSIAAICDPTGRIFGLMPHPEAYLSPFNHPHWQRQKLDGTLPKQGLGQQIFTNAVKYAAENVID